MPWNGAAALPYQDFLHDAFVDRTALKALSLFANAVFVILAASLLSYLWRWKIPTRIRKKSLLPSPAPALPTWMGAIGGHTLLLRLEKLHEQLEGWAAEFGGDFEITMFGKRVVVITGLADIRRILALRPSKFKRGLAQTKANWAATELELIPSMFFDEGTDWGRSRRLISPNLSGHSVRAMLPIISKIGERLCARLGAQADAGEIVEAKKSFERFTHDVVALSAFGIDVDSIGAAAKGEASPSYDAIESAMSTLMALNFDVMKIHTDSLEVWFPGERVLAFLLETSMRLLHRTVPVDRLGWKYLSRVLPWVHRAMEHSHRLRDVVQSAIDVARRESNQTGYAPKGLDKAHPGTPPPKAATGVHVNDNLSGGTLLRNIVGKRNGKAVSDRKTFSDVEALHQVKGLFVGGTETTASGLAWSMYYLSKNPERFKRCRKEALRVAPLSDGMASTSDQLSELVFCAAVFKEALRLRNAGPYLLLHSTADHTLDTGVKLGKMQTVCVLARAASVSDDAFTKGKEFIPERWIETEREEAIRGNMEGGNSIRHIEEAFLPFGSGPRVCPGQELARAEATIILAAICFRFDVALAPCQSDPPDEIMRFTAGPRAVMLRLTKKEQ